MGNLDSRYKYDYGYMAIQTANPIYNPGSVVSGTIYLRIGMAAPARQVVIEVKGTEKVSWMDSETRHHEGRQETVQVKRKHKREIFHFSAPCFQFSVPQLMVGDYTIPFSFVLPPSLPSSFQFMRPEMHQRPKGRVKYSLRATMEDHHGKAMMKNKQVIILREMGDNYQTDITRTDEHDISTWCCINQGRSRITTKFDKNVFEPHEVCKAYINVDNSNCNLNMEHVSLSLEQELTLTAGGHRFSHTFPLTTSLQPGVHARANKDEQRVMEIDLKNVAPYNPPTHRKKAGQQKQFSVEDLFMLRNLQAKCSGAHIQNNYFLSVRCRFAGCTCCSNLPVTRIPLTIVPIINPQVWIQSQP